MKIRYKGKIPVRLHGTRGEIPPGTTLTLPEKIAANLLQDQENWEKGEPEEKKKKKKEEN